MSERASVSLQVEPARRDRDRLRVPYRLHNHHDQPIYVFDLLPDTHGQLGRAGSTLRRDLAQIRELEPGRVELLLGVVERSGADPRVTHVYPPFASTSEVAPGKVHAGEVIATLPLREWSLWRPPADARDRVTVRSLVLVIEYSLAQPLPQHDRIGWFGRAYRIREDAPFERAQAEVPVSGLELELVRTPR